MLENFRANVLNKAALIVLLRTHRGHPSLKIIPMADLIKGCQLVFKQWLSLGRKPALHLVKISVENCLETENIT